MHACKESKNMRTHLHRPRREICAGQGDTTRALWRRALNRVAATRGPKRFYETCPDFSSHSEPDRPRQKVGQPFVHFFDSIVGSLVHLFANLGSLACLLALWFAPFFGSLVCLHVCQPSEKIWNCVKSKTRPTMRKCEPALLPRRSHAADR